LLWSGASYTALPLPFWSLLAGYSASEAKGINDQGDVVGNLIKSDGTRHAVIWPAGKAATDIGTLAGYKSSMVVGVNSKGMVLTCAYNAADSTGAPSYAVTNTKTFVWDKGIRTALSRSALGLPTATGTTSQSIPEGECVAWFHFPLLLGAVYFPQSVMTNQSGQWLINDSVNAVGWSVLSQVK
jgi:probable HAF family extracellular repeat protein